MDANTWKIERIRSVGADIVCSYVESVHSVVSAQYCAHGGWKRYSMAIVSSFFLLSMVIQWLFNGYSMVMFMVMAHRIH
jgi:hypothetical protein